MSSEWDLSLRDLGCYVKHVTHSGMWQWEGEPWCTVSCVWVSPVFNLCCGRCPPSPRLHRPPRWWLPAHLNTPSAYSACNRALHTHAHTDTHTDSGQTLWPWPSAKTLWNIHKIICFVHNIIFKNFSPVLNFKALLVQSELCHLNTEAVFKNGAMSQTCWLKFLRSASYHCVSGETVYPVVNMASPLLLLQWPWWEIKVR